MEELENISDVVEERADVQSPRNVYYAIKSVFQCPYTKSQGLLIIVLDGNRRSLLRFNLALSSDAGLFESTDITSNYKKIESRIYNLRLSGKGLNLAFMEAIIKEIGNEFGNQNSVILLLEWTRNYDRGSIEAKLSEIINKTLSDKSEMKLDIEQFIEDETGVKEETEADRRLEGEPVVTAEGEEETVPAELKIEPSVILQIDPVIDPVNGKLVLDLKKGEFVVIKVTDRSKLGIFLSKALNAIDENGAPRFMMVPVRKIETDGRTQYTLEVDLGYNIIGRITTHKIVKISKLVPDDTFADVGKEKGSVWTNLKKPEIIFLGSVVIVFILVLVMYILFS